MLTIIAITENPNTIAIPPEETEKLGIKNGDEVEVSKNETGEIILRTKQSERTKKFWKQHAKLSSSANRL